MRGSKKVVGGHVCSEGQTRNLAGKISRNAIWSRRGGGVGVHPVVSPPFWGNGKSYHITRTNCNDKNLI